MAKQTSRKDVHRQDPAIPAYSYGTPAVFQLVRPVSCRLPAPMLPPHVSLPAPGPARTRSPVYTGDWGERIRTHVLPCVFAISSISQAAPEARAPHPLLLFFYDRPMPLARALVEWPAASAIDIARVCAALLQLRGQHGMPHS